MVPVAQAVIYEDAMMVKFLNTSIAKVAVVRIFGSQCFTRHAYIVKVIVLGNKLFEKTQKVGLPGHIAWVY